MLHDFHQHGLLVPAGQGRRRSDIGQLSADPVLVHARASWQNADWPELAGLLKRHRNLVRLTPELALYCCAGNVQLGDQAAALTCFNYAVSAGVDRKFALSVLWSGASTTAAQLRKLFGSGDEAGEAKVKGWLDYANQSALGPREVGRLHKVRSSRQLRFSAIGSEAKWTQETFLQPRPKAIDPTTAEKYPDLVSRYLYTESLGIWHPSDCRDFDYSDGDEVEERLKNIIASASDLGLDSAELMAAQTDWPSRYHFSADRANLLRPFADELRGAKVLELGCGCGAITRYLGELGADVVAVEGSLRRAEMTAMRCHDLPAVNVVCERAQNLPFEGRFDFVTLIGVLEYSRRYVDAPDPILAMLESARRYLAPNGRLIVAIENQMGLKYLAGAPEDHGLGVFSGVNDLYDDTSVVTFGRKELEDYLLRAGFGAVETHLPFPDYKLPMLVVHPAGNCENNAKWQLGSLLANTVYYDLQKPKNPTFSLERAWHVVGRNGLAADLANSHLLVASVCDDQPDLAPERLATHFSARRAPKYFQQVEFLKDEHGDIVVHRTTPSDGEQADKSLRTKTEPYLPGRIHAEALHDVVQRPEWTSAQVKKWADVWIDELRCHLIEPCDSVKQLDWAEYKEWLPANFLDAVPRNLILGESGGANFIDLEWPAEHALPMELVVYRGLAVTFSMITSIAKPERDEWANPTRLIEALMLEFGWELTNDDCARFMPIIDGLLRRASGQSPRDVLWVKPYDLNDWYIRGEESRSAQRKPIATLYWRGAEDSFKENNTSKQTWLMNGKLQEVTLDIPSTDNKVTALRFDPAERAGYLSLRLLQIEGVSGEVLWRWDFGSESPSRVIGVKLVPVSDQDELILISTGTDPQFEVPVPKEVLEHASGGIMRVSILGFETA